MTNDDFVEELKSILNYDKQSLIDAVVELVERKLQDTPPITASEIEKAIKDSGLVHRTMLEWANRWVANEVGNRLRCGVWNGTAVDRVFESIWTEQFDTAIKDRIRGKVYAAIDSVIAERLKSLKN